MIRLLYQRTVGSLIGPAAIYIGSAALNAMIPFLLLPLIARWLGPADFGVIGGFAAIATVLVMLVGLNAYGFISVGYYRDGEQTLPRLVGAATTIILTMSAIIGVVGGLGAGAVERLTAIDPAWLWTLLAAATGQAIMAIGLTVAQTIRRPMIYASFQLGYSLTLGVLALILVGALEMGWPGRALAQALAALGVATGALLWLGSTGRITATADRATLRQVLSFGVLLLPHSMAAVAMGSMDRLALGGSSSPAVVGQYFLALQVASAFTALAAAVNQAWVPWLFERLARNDAAARSEVFAAIRIGGALLCVGAAAMAALALPIVLLIGGEPFRAAALPLRILAFYAALQAWYTLLSAFLFYTERVKLMSGLTTSVAVVQAIAILIGMRWEAAGVATALLLSAMLGAVAISLTVWRLLGNAVFPAAVSGGAEVALVAPPRGCDNA